MHDNMGKRNMGYYYAWKAFLATQWSLRGAAFTRRKEGRPLLDIKKWCKFRAFTWRNEQNGNKFLYVTKKKFLSNNESQKRGDGGFFLTKISLPKAKETKLKARKWGFLNHNFTPLKEKGLKIPSQNQSFPRSFLYHFYRGKLHFMGLARWSHNDGWYLDLFEWGLFAAILLSPKNVRFDPDLIKPWDICYV
jgi:hypothetical protein